MFIYGAEHKWYYTVQQQIKQKRKLSERIYLICRYLLSWTYETATYLHKFNYNWFRRCFQCSSRVIVNWLKCSWGSTCGSIGKRGRWVILSIIYLINSSVNVSVYIHIEITVMIKRLGFSHNDNIIIPLICTRSIPLFHFIGNSFQC